MTKSLVITNRLLIAMVGLIIDYLFSSDQPALVSVLTERQTVQTRIKWLLMEFFLYGSRCKILTLKVLNKFCSRHHSIFVICFQRNKAWHFM